MSVRARLLAGFFCLWAILAGILLYVHVRHERDDRYLANQIAATVIDQTVTNTLFLSMSHGHSGTEVQSLLDAMSAVPGVRRAAVTDLNGKPGWSSGASAGRGYRDRDLISAASVSGTASRITADGWVFVRLLPRQEACLTCHVGAGKWVGAALAEAGADPLIAHEQTRGNISLALTTAGIGLVGAIGAFWLLSRFLIRPVSALVAGVQSINPENWTGVRLHPAGEGEIGVLATSFNQMLDRLSASEDKYRLLVENLREGIWVIDEHEKTTFVNSCMAEMLGYTPKELRGRDFFSFVEERGIDLARQHLDHGRRGASEEFDVELVRKDRTRALATLRTSPIHDARGNYAGAIAGVQDVTERRRAEELQRETARALREAQRVAKVGSWTWNATTDTITWSEEYYRIYGRDPTQRPLGYKEHLQLYTPESAARLDAAVNKALQTGDPYELELEQARTDGTRRWVTARGETTRDESGRVDGLHGTAQDITEHKRAKETEARLVAILEATPDLVSIADPEGRLVYLNRAGRKMLGIDELADLTRYHVQEFHDAASAPVVLTEGIPTAMREGSWSGETAIVAPDGRAIAISQVILAHKAPNGTVAFLSSIARDITERRVLEAQLRQAQKMESVGQLASGIAHDFNNLLTVINGISELLLTQVSPDDPTHADVQEILRAGARAATLTNQLLAFSRQQILKPCVLNIDTVVAGMESLLRRVLGEDIDLVIVQAADVGSVNADRGQLEQVITNLAVNARDAMPQGGQLTIETRNVTIDKNYGRQHSVAVPPGSYVRLVVRDSGVGMDEATRARVFEPFFTTKGPGKGTGLGLSTVYGIVKQSHGFIWVSSQVGQGTSVEICLPQVTEPADTDRQGPTVASSAGTETILLVEDDGGLRKLATRILEPAGYTVLGAASGEEALHILARQEEAVDLLLSDVVMPGMSGPHLAEQLAQTRPGMKVLYMSGYTSDTIVRHEVATAQVPFLQKPFTKASLLRKVREALDS